MKVLDLLKDDISTRHIPVYIISASDDLEQAKYHGAIGVLQKPTSGGELNKVFATFNEILAGISIESNCNFRKLFGLNSYRNLTN